MLWLSHFGTTLVQIIIAKHLYPFLAISVGSPRLLACLLKCIKNCVCSCSHTGSLKAWSDVNFMTGI